jgi:hypothetical protein
MDMEEAMDLVSSLNTLRDPMGVPFYPWVFQLLMVLTFALHIIMVNLVVGGLCLAVVYHFSGGEYAGRLSRALGRASTVNLSLAIVLGVAPLLFVQVIYDPFWYTSNVLSAWWAMAFLAATMGSFFAAYIFYLRRRRRPAHFGAFGIIALVLALGAGIIMSAFAVQLVLPEKWQSWYIVNGQLNTYGTKLHEFRLGRFLHFMVPAFINTGIFMMLYAWYFRTRRDADPAYLDWVGTQGVRLAKFALMIQVLVGFWWLLTVPGELNFLTNPFMLLGAALGVGVLVLLFVAEKRPDRFAVPLAGLSLLAVLGMSTAREALRMKYLGRFDYSIYSYPMHIDWGSTVLFLGTFVMGLVVISYPIALVFKLGRGTLPAEER